MCGGLQPCCFLSQIFAERGGWLVLGFVFMPLNVPRCVTGDFLLGKAQKIHWVMSNADVHSAAEKDLWTWIRFKYLETHMSTEWWGGGGDRLETFDEADIFLPWY